MSQKSAPREMILSLLKDGARFRGSHFPHVIYEAGEKLDPQSRLIRVADDPQAQWTRWYSLNRYVLLVFA